MHTLNLPDSLAISLVIAAAITPVAKAFVGFPRPWLSTIPSSFAAHPVCGNIGGSVDGSSKRRRIGVFPRAIRSYRRGQKRTRLLAGDEAPRRPDGLDPKDLEWMPEGMRNCIMFPPKTVAELEEDERKAALAWKDDGRKGRVLIRRREIPLPERDPVSVCQLVMECLNLNDDPMLNYGAAVTIKHASSRNPMRNMTPKELGDFLQNDPDMVMLLANSDCRPAERAKISADGSRVLQRVKLVGSEMMQDDGWVKYGGGIERTVDVHLVKEDGCWMIDAFAFAPSEGSRADLAR